ncbi:heme NO-binding domain-containing protein [Porticoccaceae bacterium]|nr:heme NO-binding domain-containing protein [Porticoccaceae bacterium]MDC0590014.1 heme NO-binding domain-containing protein [Porticoccaceae bacterium]
MACSFGSFSNSGQHLRKIPGANTASPSINTIRSSWWITNFNSSFALLSKVDGFIHGEVKKLYPDASPPSFKCTHYSETRMQVIYQSPRCMGDVAEGLILGCAAYYQEKITVRRETIDDGSGSSERFLLKRVAGSNATTSEP